MGWGRPVPTQARLESWVLVAVEAPANCSRTHTPPNPIPPGGKAAPRSYSSRLGKTTMQVIRFKLKIIKITIQNKKKTTPVKINP